MIPAVINRAYASVTSHSPASSVSHSFRLLQSLLKIIAVAFSTIGLYTGITPLYGFGLLNGGAVGVVWGWLIVCFFMAFVALAMAEICSSFPVSARQVKTCDVTRLRVKIIEEGYDSTNKLTVQEWEECSMAY